MSLPWSGYQDVLKSAVRTTTFTSADIPVQYARAIDVIVDETVNAGSAGSMTCTINGKDPTSGKYYLLLSGAAIVAVATNVYSVGIGLPVTTNVSANHGLPAIIQIVLTFANANPVTCSVGLNMIS